MALFSAIAAAVTASAWFAGLGAIAQIGVGIALSVGANALSRAFADQPDRPKPRGVVTEVQQGADVPRSFIVGRYATRGSLAYHNTWGEADVPGDGVDDESPNAYLTRVIALSDLPVRGLARVFVDGEPVTLDMDNPDPGGRGFPIVELEANDTDTRIEPLPGGGLGVEDQVTTAYSAWVKFYDGNQTTADPFVVSKVSTDERPWGDDCIGRGVAYAVVTCLLDREQFQGIPDFLFEIDGVPQLDPSTGATGTAEYSPAAQIYNILNGYDYGGQWLWGPQGRGRGRVRPPEWATPVIEGRQPVPGAASMSNAEKIEAFGSTTVPARYRSGLEITVDQQPADVIEDLLAACGGRLAEIGTRYIMQVGDPGTAALTIQDSDIISTEGQEFTPFLGISESVNGVSATYPDPEQAWQVQNAPPLYVAEYEEEDGNRRLLTDAPLAAVPFKEQVQRLQWSVLNEARRARRHSIVLPPRFVGLLPLDYIGWDSDRNGYEDKVFRVDGVTPLINGNVAVDLTEVDPEDYDWDASSQFLPVVAGSLTPQANLPLAVTGFQVLTSSVPDSVGDRAPALELLWARGRLSGVRGIEWQVRVRSTGQIVTTGQRNSLSERRVLVAEGIGRKHEYEARARYLPRGATRVVWTAWTAAFSGDVGIPERDLADSVRDKIDAAFDKHDAVLDEAQGAIGDLRDKIIAAYGDYRLLEGRPSLLDQIEGYLIPTQQAVEDQIDAMAGNLTWAINNVAQAGETLAQAGIVTDPETGAVTIAGLHSVEGRVGQVEVDLQAAEARIGVKASYADLDQAISEAKLDPSHIPIVDDLRARLSTVEIDLDAVEGAIALKADTAEIDGLNTRLSSAEVDIDSLQTRITLVAEAADLVDLQSRLSLAEVQIDALDGANIAQTVQDTRRQTDEIDASAFNTFNDMWEALRERNTLREGAAFAQSEIYASVNEKFAAEAGAREALAVRVGNAAAAIETERRVRVSEREAVAESIANLEAELENAVTGVAGNAQAFSGLSARVTEQGGDLEAIASEFSALSAEVGSYSGAISDLAATRVTASGAISAVEQRISASYGNVTALAEAAAFAQATADEISSGYYVRLGGDDVLSFVHVRTGGTTRKTARITADYFHIEGMAVFGGDLRSDDYRSGQSGWIIRQNGSAEFNGPVISRQLQVASGSQWIDWSDLWSWEYAERRTIFIDTGYDVRAWVGSNETFVATAGVTDAGATSGDGHPPDVDWGWSAEVISNTNWDGRAQIRLKITLYSKKVNRISGSLRWRLYKVT